MIRPIALAPLLLLSIAPFCNAQAGDGFGQGYGDAYHRHHGDRTFFPGAGDDAPRGRRVIVAEYGEPYLPRGVLYNIPGPPLLVGSAVIRAKY